jgi:Ca2+-binding EF-hand superfamily protein
MEILWIAFIMTALLAAAFGAPQKSDPRKPDKLALGEEEVKQLLLLIDEDKNGKISKTEFLKFMEAEFDRLDVNRNGELDVTEIKRSRIRASRGAVGK